MKQFTILILITVLQPGFFSTVQDGGRYHYAHLGISAAGAADQLSLRIANLLAGNEDLYAPALEMAITGATLHFEHAQDVIVALAGGRCECRVNNAAIPQSKAFSVAAGAVLKCGPITEGARLYLAVKGGLAILRVLGSTATFIPGGFGGVEGRALRKGDKLRIGNATDGRGPTLPSLHPTQRDLTGAPPAAKTVQFRAIPQSGFLAPPDSHPLRVTRGAQQDWFSTAEVDKFLTSSYIVSPQSDRRGLRLSGPPLRPLGDRQLLTEGVPLGAIQVPPDGQPIILFVDQQTTGGYPKIANVAAADLHRVGQLRPGDRVRFQEISIAQAVSLLRAQEDWLAMVVAECKPPRT